MSMLLGGIRLQRVLLRKAINIVYCRCVCQHFELGKAYSHYAKKPYKSKYVSLNDQVVLLPGKERVRASKLTDNPQELVDKIPCAPHIDTIYKTLDHGLQVSNDGDCIGSRISGSSNYTWLRYSEVILRSQYVGSGLIKLGLKPCNKTFIGISASNRVEFLLALYACAGYSMVLVPLYESLGVSSILFIINQAELPVVIVNDKKNALTILENHAALPSVHHLVMMDTPGPEIEEMAEKAKMQLTTFEKLEDLGKNNRRDLVLPSPDDLICIPYTSGTTGIPKGVMISHKNMITCIAAILVVYGEVGTYGGTIISYLPTAHIYEIVNEIASLFWARRIGFYSGDIKNLMEEVKLLKPTVMPLVPRIMNVIYANVMESVKSSFLKSFLLKLALSRKEKLLKRGVVTKKTIWDKYVLHKVQEMVGGNVRIITTTSAPVSDDIIRFFRCAFGAYVFEAYGQTEVLAATMTLPNECNGGHVGPPIPCNHVKLSDVPEMGYFSKDDTGEICFKGPNVFRGYFKNPDATKDCLKDGIWLHTGDIGRWLPNGTLQIIDRKKNLFKLSQGEYIAPEKVETAYSQSKLVAQIYIDGLSEKDYVIALVVPEMQHLQSWLKDKGYGTENLSQLLQIEKLRKDFLLELHKLGIKQELNHLEQARNLAFILVPFSMENDLLTPTFKLKRSNARKQFEPIIQKLYEEGPLVKSIS